jgi:hypothetical protein
MKQQMTLSEFTRHRVREMIKADAAKAGIEIIEDRAEPKAEVVRLATKDGMQC